ncbi:hypothetical protein DH86_00002059 [Scytalidium sp. 3C]|nr:hypothetical protein DH86_00002059 [Scytalidium sp. 3C]
MAKRKADTTADATDSKATRRSSRRKPELVKQEDIAEEKTSHPEAVVKAAAKKAAKPTKKDTSEKKDAPKPKTTAKKDATTATSSSSSATGRQYWLMKAEPETRLENGVDVKFSIDDLAAKTEPEPWDAHDPSAPYYDASSKPEDPKWSVVHVSFRQKLQTPITLKDLRELQAQKDSPLANMQMLKQSRLSVSKVSSGEWEFLTELMEKNGDKINQ